MSSWTTAGVSLSLSLSLTHKHKHTHTHTHKHLEVAQHNLLQLSSSTGAAADSAPCSRASQQPWWMDGWMPLVQFICSDCLHHPEVWNMWLESLSWWRTLKFTVIRVQEMWAKHISKLESELKLASSNCLINSFVFSGKQSKVIYE